MLLASLSIDTRSAYAELLGTPVRVADSQQADIAVALLKAYTAVSRSVLSGGDLGTVIAAAAPPGVSSAAAVASAARSAFAAAVANWQLSSAAAPSNRGLKPQKLVVNGRNHYYQARAAAGFGCQCCTVVRVGALAGLQAWAVLTATGCVLHCPLLPSHPSTHPGECMALVFFCRFLLTRLAR